MAIDESNDIQLLLESMNEAFYLKDALSGKILHISPAFETIWDLSREQIIEDPYIFMNAIYDEDMPEVHNRQEEMRMGGRDFDMEYRIVHGDASLHWIHAQTKQIKNPDGSVKYYVGIAEDISQRKQQESALLESKLRYTALFENAPDAIVLAELHSGTIFEVNASAEKLFLRPRSALIGMNQSELHPPVSERESNAAFAARANLSNRLIPVKRTALRSDGSRVPVEITASLLEIDGKTLVQGIFRDLTERKKAEEQIVRLLEEKEILLQEVHHRIKNNMSLVASLLSLQADMLDDARAKEALIEMSERISGMMLMYNKQYRSKTFEALNIHDYFPELLDGIAEYFRSSSIAVYTDIIDAEIDSRILFPLGIIVNELVTNAFKHAFPNRHSGSIQVVITKGENDTYHVIVSDDGDGCPEKRSQQAGGGFGMLLVETLVQQLEGTLETRSAPGKGCEFRISFPGV
ncbi:hypothetical protein MASR2M78_36860 [Treponema sp.]